ARGNGVHAEDKLDAVAAQDLADRLAQRRRFAGEQVPTGRGEDHLATQAAYRLGHLDADRAAAEHDQLPGNGLHTGDLAVGPDVLQVTQARDGRYGRVRAGGHDDMFGGVAHALDLDHARPGQPAGAAQQVDALAGEPAFLAGVGVAGDHEVTPGQCRLGVGLRGGRRLPRAVYRLART